MNTIGLLFFIRHHSVFVEPLSAINFMIGIFISCLLRKFAPSKKNKNRPKYSMRNKKLQVWLPLILSICMVAGMFVGYRIRGNMPGHGNFFHRKAKARSGSAGPHQQEICGQGKCGFFGRDSDTNHSCENLILIPFIYRRKN